jgi:hypothetical protein
VIAYESNNDFKAKNHEDARTESEGRWTRKELLLWVLKGKVGQYETVTMRLYTLLLW